MDAIHDRAPRPARRRLHPLDWTALVLLLAGAGCVAAGLLPAADAGATVRRILPLLLFLGTVVVLAELTAAAEVFDLVASRIAILARGRPAALFGLCVLMASTTTIALNLDTTAVLLTPVMLALARRVDLPALPLAMTTVWLSNTASLLLPPSNLTNILAADRVGLALAAFAARMWLPQLVAIALTAVLLWWFFWRPGASGVREVAVPRPHRPADPVLAGTAMVACVLFVAGILLEVPIGIASGGAAGLLVAGFALRRRQVLRWGLVPLRLLAFVTGLFLVVDTIGRHGLESVMGALIGTDPGVAGVLRAATTGAVLSNAVNNLPAYVAGEAVVPVGNGSQLLALLVGTNVGPLVTPWASLATLIWFERCRAAGVTVPLRRFVLTGAVLAVPGVALTALALLAT